MRAYLLALFSLPLTLLVYSACSSDDDPAPVAGVDASLDAPLLGEGSTPTPADDADPGPGDPCGDRSGLQQFSQWPLRGGCPSRSSYSSIDGPQNATVPWTVPRPAPDTTPAVASNSHMWIGTPDGEMLVVTNIGTILYSFPVGSPIRSSAALDAEGNAIFGTEGGTLYGLAFPSAEPVDAGDAGDADAAGAGPGDAGNQPRVAFKRDGLGAIASSPVIDKDGTIYIGSLDGKLHALTRKAASIKWTATTEDTTGTSPALGQDGTIFIANGKGQLLAFAPDGTPRWTCELGAALTSPAVGGDGSIYVGDASGKLHAVDIAGKKRWSYETGGPIKNAPAVYSGVVYVGSEDKKLHAVSVVDGVKRWTFEALGAVTTPIIGRNAALVYAGSTDGKVYAITPKGSLYFAVNVRGQVKSPPAVVIGPALYVTTDTGISAVGP